MFGATLNGSSGMVRTGKMDPLDDLFENTCASEDDIFQGFGFGSSDCKPLFDQAPIPLKASGFVGCSLELQRASAASTECSTSFSAASFDSPSFNAFGDLASHRATSGDIFDLSANFMPTSALGRRARALAQAPSPEIAVPPPPSPHGLGSAVKGADEKEEEEEESPSIGARFHAAGECTPCKFFRSRRGCKDGPSCHLCHHKHDELTYSGIRRLMKKKALGQPSDMEPLPPAPAASPLMWRPPPGLPEPDCGLAHLGMSAAYLGNRC
mmetsp:Transcript_65431/g.188512  ORF Transcript_65431/g.188512 Transcript_65431/m.188512 type:complete len:268 (-) Transcript_65431:92-895(-)